MSEKIYTYKTKAWDNLQNELKSMNDDDTISVKELKEKMSDISTNAFNTNRKPDGKQMAELLADFVNSSHLSSEGDFVNGVLNEHRTLQQSIFKLFLGCIEGWAELNKNQYDLRNEATVKISKEIVDKIEDKRLPLI